MVDKIILELNQKEIEVLKMALVESNLFNFDIIEKLQKKSPKDYSIKLGYLHSNDRIEANNKLKWKVINKHCSRLNQFTIDGDEFISINCPKCKGRQGIRRKGKLVVHCYVCNRKIKELEK
jgi:ribosomal protein S27E